MRKSLVMMSFLLMAALLFFQCSDDGGSGNKADGDVVENEGNSYFDQACASNVDCEQGICYPDPEGSFCTFSCTSKTECELEKPGYCCEPDELLESFLCLPCSSSLPDGDISESDTTDTIDTPAIEDGDEGEQEPVDCEPLQLRCSPTRENWVEQCNMTGDSWDIARECAEDEVCEEGECVLGEIDGDEEQEFACGDPSYVPETVNIYFSEKLLAEESTPQQAAKVEHGTHASFPSENSDFAYLNATEEGQEIVFELDIDDTYYYQLYITYVCKQNWGEVAVYIDDAETPIQHGDEATAHRDKVDLHCESGVARLMNHIVYETTCLEEGLHKLRLRVAGKDSGSNGYAIGAFRLVGIPAQ